MMTIWRAWRGGPNASATCPTGRCARCSSREGRPSLPSRRRSRPAVLILLVNVELKANELGFGPMAALVEAVAEVIARSDSASRVLVSSFNPWAVHLWRRRVPSVRAALIFERHSMLPLRRAWLAPWVRPFALHPELVLCTPERVAAWQRRGYMVNVWTVDDPAALAACRRMGVDGVITNDPARTRTALASA